MSAAGIEVDGLGVRYGARWAVRSLSLAVASGEIVGLLGPNGAGKTTTLSVLATLRAPDEGVARVAGADVVRAGGAVRRAIGFVPQGLALYPTLTARDNLHFFTRAAGLRGRAAREAAARALDEVGLAERADEPVARFSGGMRRRLNLACAVAHRPPVWLLDEPSVGVDPHSRARIEESVRGAAGAGVAVLWSTHVLPEAERLCDRVVLIDGGRVVADDAPAALVRRTRPGLQLVLTTARPLAADCLGALPGVRADVAPDAAAEPPHRTILQVPDAAVAALAIQRVAASGAGLLDLSLREPDLEDAFLVLTGRALRD